MYMYMHLSSFVLT